MSTPMPGRCRNGSDQAGMNDSDSERGRVAPWLSNDGKLMTNERNFHDDRAALFRVVVLQCLLLLSLSMVLALYIFDAFLSLNSIKKQGTYRQRKFDMVSVSNEQRLGQQLNSTNENIPRNDDAKRKSLEEEIFDRPYFQRELEHLKVAFLNDVNQNTHTTKEKHQEDVVKLYGSISIRRPAFKHRIGPRPLNSSFYHRPKSVQRIDPLIEDRKGLRNILVDDTHELLYCFVPKVACTNWRKIMVSGLNPDFRGADD